MMERTIWGVYKALKPLKASEETATIRAAKNGDQEARRRVLEHGMRYVIPYVFRNHRYVDQYEDVAGDCFQEVYVAYDKYDPDYEPRSGFLNYLSSRLRSRIQDVRHRYFTHQPHVPYGLVNQILGSSPVTHRPETVAAACAAMRGCVSFNAAVYRDGTSLEYSEVIPSDWPTPEESVSRKEISSIMRRVLDVPTFGRDLAYIHAASRVMEDDPPTLKDVGASAGISRQGAKVRESNGRDLLLARLSAIGVRRCDVL